MTKLNFLSQKRRFALPFKSLENKVSLSFFGTRFFVNFFGFMRVHYAAD